MKSWIKWIWAVIAVIFLLGHGGTALAQEGDAPAQFRQGRGVRGEVTEVTGSTLTISTRNGETVSVNVSAETKVLRLGSGAEGDVSSIQVGDLVGVRGPKNEDGSIEARIVRVLPQELKDMAKVRGRVSAIEDSTLVVKTLKGEEQIATTAETQFRLGKEEGNLSDIEVGSFVLAVGDKQNEAFTAKFVVALSREQIQKHMLRGTVESIDPNAGTLTVKALRGEQNTFTVKTTEQTEYRIPDVESPTLADIQVGTQVIILGWRDESDSQSGTARLIAVLPAELQGSFRAAGKVTALSDTSFTLQTLRRGEVTVLITDSTQYRARGEQEVSFADIAVGSKVLIVGEPVEGQEKTVQAKLVGIKLEK